MMKNPDIIVIGAGHAGIEAAHAAARLGVGVMLVTLNPDAIGALSCNPAVGGVSKGHLVREVDALGGCIGRLADACALGYRRLNKSKGKAVWATRAQVDLFRYPLIARGLIQKQKNVEIFTGQVKDILVKNGKATGIVTNFGHRIRAKKVIVCAGTFLKSLIHIGLESFPGGRLYELSCDDLFKSIKKMGMKMKHFKTGTCARLDAASVDTTEMIEQKPEYDVEPFSRHTREVPEAQLSCYITHTNEKTHRIIRRNLKYSPLYSGKITSRGVRYCPSLEDKIVRFKDKDRHQIFIEPEGWDSLEIYPNGISTSLPLEVQAEFIRSIAGLRHAVLIRPGYGIEHGVIDARQCYPTLESKKVNGVYFAGQVNGTTGYEEAAAQGLIAGINAALSVKNMKPFILGRQEALIGVLIDDLTSRGTDEPYRMFTSRSEFRLRLRESNADMRLLEAAVAMGLADKKELEIVEARKQTVQKSIRSMRKTMITVDQRKKISLFEYLKRPEVSFTDIASSLKEKVTDPVLAREIEIRVKYETFFRREARAAGELKDMDQVKIPAGFCFEKIPSLSHEIREKLKKFRPATLGEALRISGMTPAAVMIIYACIVKTRKKPRHKVTKSQGHM